MSRTHRLLDLLQQLRERRQAVTADVLATDLGVSVRTLYRDIDVLRAQGAEIDGAAGFGYVLKPGFHLPPLMFTPEEIEALLLGSLWVAQRKDLAMEGPARSALAKISAVLPDDLTDLLDSSGLIVAPGSEGHAMTVDAGIIRSALRKERKLTITYVDAAEAASKRTVWPVAVGVYQATQILAAWCELRGDYRHFRLDRIRGVEVLDARPPRRRVALFKEWRERECIPDDVAERTFG